MSLGDSEPLAERDRFKTYPPSAPEGWDHAPPRTTRHGLIFASGSEPQSTWDEKSAVTIYIIRKQFPRLTRFPHSRVKLQSREMLTVPRSIVNRIIKNPATDRVENVLVGDRAHNLIQFFATRVHHDFEQEMNLSELDRDYRRRYESNFVCEDGRMPWGLLRGSLLFREHRALGWRRRVKCRQHLVGDVGGMHDFPAIREDPTPELQCVWSHGASPTAGVPFRPKAE